MIHPPKHWGFLGSNYNETFVKQSIITSGRKTGVGKGIYKMRELEWEKKKLVTFWWPTILLYSKQFSVRFEFSQILSDVSKIFSKKWWGQANWGSVKHLWRNTKKSKFAWTTSYIRVLFWSCVWNCHKLEIRKRYHLYEIIRANLSSHGNQWNKRWKAFPVRLVSRLQTRGTFENHWPNFYLVMAWHFYFSSRVPTFKCDFIL